MGYITRKHPHVSCRHSTIVTVVSCVRVTTTLHSAHQSTSISDPLLTIIMSSTLLTAATDICVIAGVAAVATAAINSKFAPFKTSLGAEYDDDSLVAAETTGTPGQHQSPLQPYADDDDKKALTVTVTEVAVTPPLAEMEAGDFFAGAKAA